MKCKNKIIKKNIWAVTLVLMVLFMFGHQTSSAKSDTNPGQKLDTAKEKTTQAGQAVSDYAYAKKEEYIKIMKTKLNELEKEINDLDKQAKRAKSKAKTVAKKKIKALKKDFRKLGKKMDALESSTENKWDDVKAKYNQSVDEMISSIRTGREWLSKKIAP